jgi:hypothetical protein
MPQSLLDMFQPQNPAGEPVGFGDAVTSRSNSLIGLGLGMLQPSNPLRGQSTWGNALEGFQTGAALDARTAAEGARLRHQKTQEARQAANDAFQRQQALLDRDLKERQFVRSDPANVPSEFTRAARDLGLTPGSPEHTQFAKQFYAPKAEGNLAVAFEQRRAIAANAGLDVNDPKVKSWIAGGGTLTDEGKALPAEMASRVALGGKFLDEAPAIRAKIESGMATDSITGRAKTYFNMGDQGELSRKIKSGTDALLRSLTGAGMPDAEARKYVARYELQPLDSKETALSKFDQLHDELARAEQEAFRGRGGIPRDIAERRRAAHQGTTGTTVAPGPTAAPSAGGVPPPPAGFTIVAP